MNLISSFSKIKDPRRTQGLRTNLPQLLCMVVISNLCGYYGSRAIARFSKIHKKLLTAELKLKHKPPSHVSFSTVLNQIDPQELIACFQIWSAEFSELKKGDNISGDGKALGSTVKDMHGSGQSFEAVVSLFCQNSGLVHSLKEYRNNKESEIGVVQKTVETIVGTGNHYVIQLKGNQKTLFREAQRIIVEDSPLDRYEEHEKDHGRQSSWYVHVFDASESPKALEWKNLRRIIHVHKRTLNTKTGKVSHNDRLYISDLYQTCAQKYHEDWKIENNLHWVKDVIQNEDKNGFKQHNAPINISTLNSLALNIHSIFGKKSVSESQMIFCSNIRKTLKILRT